MTSQSRRTASAAAVSRILAAIPASERPRRARGAGHPGYAVFQPTPHRVHIEWHGRHPERAFAVMARHLRYSFDTEPITVSRGLTTTYLVHVLVVRAAAAPTHLGPDPSHGGLTTHTGLREDCTGPDCAPSRSTARRAARRRKISETLFGRLCEIEGLYLPEGSRLARAPGATRGDNRTQGAWVWTLVHANGTPVSQNEDDLAYAVGSQWTMTELVKAPLAANPDGSGDVHIEPTNDYQEAMRR